MPARVFGDASRDLRRNVAAAPAGLHDSALRLDTFDLFVYAGLSSERGLRGGSVTFRRGEPTAHAVLRRRRYVKDVAVSGTIYRRGQWLLATGRVRQGNGAYAQVFAKRITRSRRPVLHGYVRARNLHLPLRCPGPLNPVAPVMTGLCHVAREVTTLGTDALIGGHGLVIMKVFWQLRPVTPDPESCAHKIVEADIARLCR